MNTTKEISRDDLESYFKVYREPSVLALRGVLDDFAAGKTNEEIPDFVRSELESYRKFLGGKFIVTWYGDSIAGGKVVVCLFRDKPDTLINFWLYKLGGTDAYALRGVWETDVDKQGLKAWTNHFRDLVFSDPHAL